MICTHTSLITTLSYDEIEIQRTYKKISCESYQNSIHGCFKEVDSSTHKYGTINPPVPQECCSEFEGPPIGEIVEDDLNDDEEVIVSYCDYGTKWNYDEFKKLIDRLYFNQELREEKLNILGI